eukprot:CAMPEP_0172877042 /NCGR_PEP_ID=MMETSP1075-20121228/105957_1 /TAXON_ID=2916 /ORGANISM="Ceratium fusus, Strain PA161109" /LENGTH=154 /DNA_ID=CAMNT_0013728519 /DNA_START=169 /DNA_END=632 /DNA_ORIENTATION=+
MGKSTKSASWATASLVAQSFAEKIWVVQELSRAMAQVARIPMTASAGVVELICARFASVGQPTAFQEDRPASIAATMVKRTTSVVVEDEGVSNEQGAVLNHEASSLPAATHHPSLVACPHGWQTPQGHLQTGHLEGTGRHHPGDVCGGAVQGSA